MARRTDSTQAPIVEALRELGYGCLDLHLVGHGAPDILCCSPDGRRVYLAELKTPNGRISPRQAAWRERWPGIVHVWRSRDEALRTVGVLGEGDAN